MTTLFVKKLTNMDFSFLDTERGMVGESWLIDIELTGELDQQGMILDFGIVKKVVRDYVDQTIDHCLVVPTGSKACKVTEKDDALKIEFTLASGKTIVHQSPKQAICLIDAEKINRATIQHYLLVELGKILPSNVKKLELRLYGEPHLREYYQYSHGLSQHDGNCQRIAHGHRSGLNISIDGEQNERWRDYWVDRWSDIYLGTDQHIIHRDEDDGYYHFHYQAPQGLFTLTMPQELCYLINKATTVENIAEHLFLQLQQFEPNKLIEVQAFEGIGKGAIVRS